MKRAIILSTPTSFSTVPCREALFQNFANKLGTSPKLKRPRYYLNDTTALEVAYASGTRRLLISRARGTRHRLVLRYFSAKSDIRS